MKKLRPFRLTDQYVEDCYILYLPVFMRNESQHCRIPGNLKYLWPMLEAAIADYDREYNYIYVSVESRFVSKSTYQKRPGWHVDGYGTDDENYCWTNIFGTEYLDIEGDYQNMMLSHGASVAYFDYLAGLTPPSKILQNHLYRLEGSIHRTPLIEMDCHRTFIKISFSKHEYNLKGNAKNYLFNYNWQYYDRNTVRNCPIFSNNDFYKEST